MLVEVDSILGSIGGPAALLAEHNIKNVEVLEYPELGMEAIWKIDAEDFPAYISVDDKGNDFFADVRDACSKCAARIRGRARRPDAKVNTLIWLDAWLVLGVSMNLVFVLVLTSASSCRNRVFLSRTSS